MKPSIQPLVDGHIVAMAAIRPAQSGVRIHRAQVALQLYSCRSSTALQGEATCGSRTQPRRTPHSSSSSSSSTGSVTWRIRSFQGPASRTAAGRDGPQPFPSDCSASPPANRTGQLCPRLCPRLQSCVWRARHPPIRRLHGHSLAGMLTLGPSKRCGCNQNHRDRAGTEGAERDEAGRCRDTLPGLPVALRVFPGRGLRTPSTSQLHSLPTSPVGGAVAGRLLGGGGRAHAGRRRPAALRASVFQVGAPAPTGRLAGELGAAPPATTAGDPGRRFEADRGPADGGRWLARLLPSTASAPAPRAAAAGGSYALHARPDGTAAL